MPGSFLPTAVAVTPAAQIAGASNAAARTAKCHGRLCGSATAITMAASDPAVPGAMGEYPMPNQVASSRATLVLIFGLGLRVGGGRDDVLLRRPIPQVDETTALTAEREIRI